MKNIRPFIFAKILVLFLIITILITGCVSNLENGTEGSEVRVHPELFRDRDALFERMEFLHDFNVVSYTDEELNSIKEKIESKDYKYVLKDFVVNNVLR